MGSGSSLIVGDPDDPHAAAVAAALEARGGNPFLIDSASLGALDFLLSDEGLSVFGADGQPLGPDASRGWLRRLAPEGWQDGVRADALAGVVREAWTSVVVSLADLARVEWLTPLGRIFAAEDKLAQLRACRRLGFPSPPSVVLSRPARIPAEFGEELIVKPFAAGHYREDGGDAKVVYATAMSREDPRLELLAGAPFLVQPRLEALAHRRIVTVAETAWVCELPAAGLDPDWRATERAHSSFKEVDDPEAGRRALRLASDLGVGYSSQDWLVDPDGESHLLDLNPAGQWLFLPVAEAVSAAIAAWLVGDGRD